MEILTKHEQFCKDCYFFYNLIFSRNCANPPCFCAYHQVEKQRKKVLCLLYAYCLNGYIDFLLKCPMLTINTIYSIELDLNADYVVLFLY